MKKQLRLSGNYGKFLDDVNYTKAENEQLEIEVVTSFGHNVDLYAKLDNGSQEKSIKLKDRKFVIEDKFLNVGECFIKIVAMVGNKRVGEYKCPSILIVEIDNDKLIVDKLKEFDLKINKLLEEYKDEKDYIRYELSRVQKSVKQLIIAE